MAHDSLIETECYRARLAQGPADIARALGLRARLFRGNRAAADGDGFDPRCRHMLVEDRNSGALVATYRLFDVADGSRIGESYSAQFYTLDALADFAGPMVEVGRFCIAPDVASAPDVLRLACHVAPLRWRPRVKAPDVFRFAARLRRAPNAKRALKAMPPLLRSYLAMGGWVSDHAVVDRDLGTLHVFTGLEVSAVPQARARALRGLVGA